MCVCVCVCVCVAHPSIFICSVHDAVTHDGWLKDTGALIMVVVGVIGKGNAAEGDAVNGAGRGYGGKGDRFFTCACVYDELAKFVYIDGLIYRSERLIPITLKSRLTHCKIAKLSLRCIYD